MLRRVAYTTAFILLLNLSAAAQNVTGSIAGTVTDPSGGGVPDATVDLVNTDQNATLRTLKTDASGNYSAPALPIGTYTVTVSAPGFKKASRTAIRLNVNDKLTLNIPLEVGEVTQEVTVQEAPVQVQTQTAESASLISGTQIRELSLNNRNYEQLVALSPGVSAGVSDQLYVGTTNPAGQTNTVDFSINGARNSQNNWTVDGADNVDRGSNVTLLDYPSVDALAEFRVLRGEYSAEFGRAGGGQINVVTKSGTKDFHGNAYEFVRNDAFAANNWINNANRVNLDASGKASVPPLRYNNFGYTIGGPVYIPHVYNVDKSKTFFFWSEEWRKVITYGANQGIVPTAQELGGVFPSPVCVSFAAGACQQTATQITNINPVAQQYIKDIFSKIPAGAPSNTLYAPLRNVYDTRQELIRIDQNFSQKFTMFGRFLMDTIPTIEPGGLFTGSPLPNVATTSTNSPGHSVVVRATWTITPTLLDDIGYAYSYGAIISNPLGLLNTSLSPDIKVPLPFPSTLARVPSLTFTNGTSITGFGPYRDYDRNHELWNNASKIIGRHTIRFGGQVFKYQKTENTGGNNVGSFSFVGTGAPEGTNAYQQAFANFLLGNAASFSQASQDITPNIKAWQWGVYAQDDFRFRPNLTFNLGIRYDQYRQPWDAHAMLTNFDPALYNSSNAPQINPATGLIVAGTGRTLNGIIINNQNSPWGRHVANESPGNWAPRAGFAWDPTGSGKTSIRSGYGIYYDSILFGVYEQNIFTNPPYVNNPTILNTSLSNPLAGTPSVSLAPPALHATPLPYNNPYTQQWSFDVQHQFGSSWIADVGYYGAKGTHLIGIVDINEVRPGLAQASGLVAPGTQFTSANEPRLNALRPYLGYNAINAIETEFNNSYNSLQASLEKRFAGNSVISLAYTYSKDITDNRSDRSSAPQNTYNLHEGERGLAQFDRRHVFSASYVYDLPFFRHSSGFISAALGNWEISGIAQIGTGLPLNPLISATLDPAGLGILGPSAASPRPNWGCNPNSGAPHSVYQWFNTSCLVAPPPGQITPGNAGRSIIHGPGYNRWDFSLFKNFRFRENLNLQLRGEAFNVFNHPSPLNVNTTLGSSTYGQVTSFHDPRIFQIGAKLSF